MIHTISVSGVDYNQNILVQEDLTLVASATLTVKTNQKATGSLLTKELVCSYDDIETSHQVEFVLTESEVSSLGKGIYYYTVSSGISILTGGLIVGAAVITSSDGTEEDIYLIQDGAKVFVMMNDSMQRNTDYILTSTYEYQADGNPDIYYNTQVISFSSDYYPLFCTFSSVKGLVELYHIQVSDELIYKTIRDNSEAIKRLTTRTDIADWDLELPHEFGEYVKNKCIYDLVLNAYVNSSVTSGHSKSLGELEIRNQTDSSVYELLKTLKENMYPWYDLAMGTGIAGKAAMAAVVRATGADKGFSYPYPREIN